LESLRHYSLRFKNLYNTVASYLLAWVGFFALTAYGFYWLADLITFELGFYTQGMFWQRASQITGFSPRLSRLPLFLIAHIALIYVSRRLIRRAQAQISRFVAYALTQFERLTQRGPKKRVFVEVLFTTTVSALLVAFVVQPTMVPFDNQLESWGARVANLLDGSASDAFVESTVGIVRAVVGHDVEAMSVSEADYDRAAPLTGPQPVMDRWDPLLREATRGDLALFAQTKAFMWVESAGRQFALSHTACAGLMQFCLGTARTQPYRKIFGVGQVAACKCKGPCAVSKPVRRALETGGARALEFFRDTFPCDLGDARFNPRKAITAGAAFVHQLREAYGGNMYLMYIGYNSGPAVSRALYKRLGNNANASLKDIGQHLERALRRYYGKSAKQRARGLLKVHLPKVQRAEQRYLDAAWDAQ
jgi:hypothetical protein